MRRAFAHSQDLTARIRERVRGDVDDNLSIGKHYDATDECFIFVLEEYTPPEVEREWSLVVGDAIHNARSALDYLAWQIVRLGAGPHPPLKPTAVQFPILSRPPQPGVTAAQAFEREAKRRLPGADKTHLSVVQRYQPIINQPSDPNSHPFAMLNLLSNHDKHRSLRLVEHFLYDFEADLISQTNFNVTGVLPEDVTKLEPGTELFRIFGEPTGTGQPDVGVKFNAVGVIVFGSDPDLPDLPFVGVEWALSAIIGLLGNIVGEFDRIL
jgi:hypothetical protein